MLSHAPTLILILLATSSSFASEVGFAFHDTGGRTESITLDRFLFDGRATAAAPQVRTLAPGVTELTLESPAAGSWSFAVADESSYFGFGERFDRLNHAHTILQNASRDVADEKGALTYQPIPFYMSLRGYGLWLDTTSEATFDLNVTESSRILVNSFGSKLRVVLFEGPDFRLILQRFTALVGRQQLPPYWAFAPWKARDYHRNTQEVYED
jgi:alpha-D-xyloside xylohydrolase